MYDNQSKGISYTAGFFMIIVFVVVGAFLSEQINKQIWIYWTGQSYDLVTRVNPVYSNVLKIMQAVSAIITFFIPTLAVAALLSHKPAALLGFSPKVRLDQVGLVLLIVVASLVVSTSLSYFNNNIPLPEEWRIKFDNWENEYNRQVEAIVSLKNQRDYILALVVMAFLPALCEETLFRGGLQNFLSRGTRMPWLAIIVVSILFSLAHFSFYGFLYRVFLGMILGAIYHYSGKLWLSILAHFINNAIALTVLYVNIQNGKPIREAMKTDATGYWGILALPLLVGLFILFQRVSGTNRRLA
jgi:uncharacterized protein